MTPLQPAQFFSFFKKNIFAEHPKSALKYCVIQWEKTRLAGTPKNEGQKMVTP